MVLRKEDYLSFSNHAATVVFFATSERIFLGFKGNKALNLRVLKKLRRQRKIFAFKNCAQTKFVRFTKKVPALTIFLVLQKGDYLALPNPAATVFLLTTSGRIFPALRKIRYFLVNKAFLQKIRHFRAVNSGCLSKRRHFVAPIALTNYQHFYVTIT